MNEKELIVDENGYEWTNWENRDYWRIAGSEDEWNMWNEENPMSNDLEIESVQSESIVHEPIAINGTQKKSLFELKRTTGNKIVATMLALSMIIGVLGYIIVENDIDSDTVLDDDNMNSEGEWMVYSVEVVSGLPNCELDTLGRLYYVESDNNFQVCKSVGWEIITIESSYQSNSFNGSNGSNGSNGFNGSNGSNGANGFTGLNAAFKIENEPAGLNCENGGKLLAMGHDLNFNSILDSQEVTQAEYICNSISVIGNQNSVLSRIDSPPVRCEAGGYKLSHGIDNGDGAGVSSNGILEIGEIDNSVIYCSNYEPEEFYVFPENGDLVCFKSDSHLFYIKGSKLFATGNSTQIPQLLLSDVSIYSTYSMGSSVFLSVIKGGLEQLWKSDGTLVGTELVHTFDSGIYEGNIVSLGGLIYFAAGNDLKEIWVSNGTDSGTYMLKNTGGIIRDLTTTGSKLFFASDIPATIGNELWTSDGTSAGTNLVADLMQNGDGYRAGMTPFGNKVIFNCIEGYLCISDGTSSGTNIISSGLVSMNADSQLKHDGKMYFRSYLSLWVTDGTLNGTHKLLDGMLIESNYIEFDNKLYFSTSNWPLSGYALMEYDTANNSTSETSRAPHVSFEESILESNGILYMQAQGSTSHSSNEYAELWIYDIVNNTWKDFDLSEYTLSSHPKNFIEFDGDIFFTSDAYFPIGLTSIFKVNGKVVTVVENI